MSSVQPINIYHVYADWYSEKLSNLGELFSHAIIDHRTAYLFEVMTFNFPMQREYFLKIVKSFTLEAIVSVVNW